MITENKNLVKNCYKENWGLGANLSFDVNIYGKKGTFCPFLGQDVSLCV